LLATISGLAFLGFYLDLPSWVVRGYARDYAGLSLVVPVASIDQEQLGPKRKRAEQDVELALVGLRQATAEARHVQLLLCSGWLFVGHDGVHPGWLTEILRDDDAKSRHLEVLLLDPRSESGAARAGQVMPGHDAASYEAGCDAVLWTLRSLKEDLGVQVTVRRYAEDPIWQMVILPSELYLMYAARHVPTGYSPMYVFRRDAIYGLHHGLTAVWERRWANSTEVDLSKIERPVSGSLIDVAKG
jgi:hypothetical protein